MKLTQTDREADPVPGKEGWAKDSEPGVRAEPVSKAVFGSRRLGGGGVVHCSPTLHPAGVVAGGARVVGQSLER